MLLGRNLGLQTVETEESGNINAEINGHQRATVGEFLAVRSQPLQQKNETQKKRRVGESLILKFELLPGAGKIVSFWSKGSSFSYISWRGR